MALTPQPAPRYTPVCEQASTPHAGASAADGLACDHAHREFMAAALDQAAAALERGEFPVGAVIVHQGRIVAHGHRRHSVAMRGQVNELDHAEILALRDLLDQHPEIPLAEVTIYATLEPCLMCYAALLISGVRAIVYAYEDAMGGGTNLPLAQLQPLYRELEVSIVPHVLRDQSLALFKRFFSRDGNPYLHDTLLARYTLAQS